jgi:hypothetical protein
MTIPSQAPDSSVAGYLQPIPSPTPPISPPSPGNGDDFENYLQQFVAGISGLDGTLVRPRWQPEPPNIPSFDTTWVAVGITRRQPIGPYAAVIHNGAGNGQDLMQRHEDIVLEASFYGPNADQYASNLHSGLMIWQNKASLRLAGLAFTEITESIRVPELIKQQWVDRVDKIIYLRRIIQNVYPVLNILSVGGFVNAEARMAVYKAPFNVAAPVAGTEWDNGQTIWDNAQSKWDAVP